MHDLNGIVCLEDVGKRVAPRADQEAIYLRDHRIVNRAHKSFSASWTISMCSTHRRACKRRYKQLHRIRSEWFPHAMLTTASRPSLENNW
ncbi:hypothetical protein [Rugamonas sp. DEMB1]|uniref:hypothetical protein n=1 Tax=Rugamonas sp. DEMB1 TaxID=3039386 RepID=UPI0024485222|nr:hypothetical protein [Rugamonas sp. DEMB1]WGG50941.1 hypothetical protein QC826_01100 [Rugamonas sp. DEMB1]